MDAELRLFNVHWPIVTVVAFNSKGVKYALLLARYDCVRSLGLHTAGPWMRSCGYLMCIGLIVTVVAFNSKGVKYALLLARYDCVRSLGLHTAGPWMRSCGYLMCIG